MYIDVNRIAPVSGPHAGDDYDLLVSMTRRASMTLSVHEAKKHRNKK